jgi:hypothetical protein
MRGLAPSRRQLPIAHHRRRAFASSYSNKSQKGPSNPLFAWYSQQLDARPLFTKCMSAGIVSFVGDLSSQTVLKKAGHDPDAPILDRIDWKQTARFVGMNLFMVGPTLHYWYRYLGKVYPGSRWTSVANRVFWDEFVFTPVYYPVFLTILWKLEHGFDFSMKKIGDMLWNEMPTLILAEWAIYVPAQAINFRFIPGKFQVLFSNVVGIVWNGYLSYTAQQATGNHEAFMEDAASEKEVADSVQALNLDNPQPEGAMTVATKTEGEAASIRL